ncbi:MAG: MBL fold metallo-hydrolase [Gammaproteobacteria bacterium]|nr:MBL fold metallo-hydrolase [Gammaproteobacteria bacterium]
MNDSRYSRHADGERHDLRQLQDSTSSTWTYLLADEASREALLIDPVFGQAARDLALVQELGLSLRLVAETHAHADHVTAAWLLKQKTGCAIASARAIGAEHVDLPLEEGDEFGVGDVRLRAMSTPGHTDGCMSFLLADESRVFTGDALLIRGCGRSDFQQGSAKRLFQSITQKLFALPDACLVYPAHDYNGRTVSTIGEEKQFNARAGGGANERDFVEYMQAMKLPHPKLIEEAVPANLRSGRPEDGKLPEEPDWAEIRVTYAGVPEIDIEWLEHRLRRGHRARRPPVRRAGREPGDPRAGRSAASRCTNCAIAWTKCRGRSRWWRCVARGVARRSRSTSCATRATSRVASLSRGLRQMRSVTRPGRSGGPTRAGSGSHRRGRAAGPGCRGDAGGGRREPPRPRNRSGATSC